MKIYAIRDGRRVEAEVSDGALYLEIGSRDDGHGRKLPPIDTIDHDARTYGRLGVMKPFPERFYFERDISWKPSTETP